MTAGQKERVKTIRSHARRLAEVNDRARATVALELVQLCDALLAVEPEPRKTTAAPPAALQPPAPWGLGQ